MRLGRGNCIVLSAIVFFVLCGLLNLPEWPEPDSTEHTFHHPSPSFQIPFGCQPEQKDTITVHLIPHSHQDVGWIKTVDNYYTEQVKHILDSTIDALLADSAYRFTQVEIAYFHRWWMETNDSKRLTNVHGLVCEGRLQFAHGGWVIADEATVYYGDEIDQLTRGRTFLKATFGNCAKPNIAWQLDTFGHARDRADLFVKSGFDGLIFSRIDWQEKDVRRKQKSLDFLWDSESYSLGVLKHKLFTHVLYDTYCNSGGTCFDTSCDSHEHLPESVVESVMQFIRAHVNASQTPHVLLPMGCDFSFTNARLNFKLMDQLIRKLDGMKMQRRQLSVIYSTPTCYIWSINQAIKRLNLTLPVRGGDFFPYTDRENSYWTGYYTSRPSLKKMIRSQSRVLKMLEQMSVFVPKLTATDQIDQLRQQVAILQHHDAITGTAQQHVTDDYIRHLSRTVDACSNLTIMAIQNLSEGQLGDGIQQCPLRNISLCGPSMGDWVPSGSNYTFFVIVYNLLGTAKLPFLWFQIPVRADRRIKVQVQLLDDSSKKEITHQLLPVTHRTINIPHQFSPEESNHRLFTKNLVFNAMEHQYSRINPLGFTTFKVTVESIGKTEESDQPKDHVNWTAKSRSGRMEYTLTHNEYNLIVHARHRETNETARIVIALYYYQGSIKEGSISGAYLFSPETGLLSIQKPYFRHVSGACMHEITAYYSLWATLSLRLHNDGHLEVEWTVGPIPDTHGSISHEVVVLYTVEGTDYIQPKTYGEFFTDSDGRRLIRRIRHLPFLDGMPLNLPANYRSALIARNYYPVVNRIMLKGSIATATRSTLKVPFGLAIYTDRAQGGSSLKNGQIELMLHRRLVNDDGEGVGERLMEDDIDGTGLTVRGTHWIHFDELSVIEADDRSLATLVTKSPIALFQRDTSLTTPENIIFHWSGLRNPLPNNIHVLTLVLWPLVNRTETGKSQLLLRLENTRNNTVDNKSSEWLSLETLFTGIRIKRAIEMTLTADETKESSGNNRLHWYSEQISHQREGYNASVGPVIVRLYPDEIHTFLCDFEPLGRDGLNWKQKAAALFSRKAKV